jgi:hypothetical protein
MIILLILFIAAIAFAIYWFFFRGAGSLTPRPPGPQGAARWAFTIASPLAKAGLAPDAIPVEISGQDILPDGRMAANRGSWKVTFSSFSASQRMPITVDHLGNGSAGAKSTAGVIQGLGTPPGTFPDSTVIFAATAGKGAAGERKVSNPVQVGFDTVAGSHVWLIKIKVGSVTQTHVVRWDGIWLEIR